MNTRTPKGTSHGALKITLKNWLRDNRSGITAFAAVVLLYGVFALFGVGCPIKFLTGIGPLYAMHILMKNTNTLAMAYNQAHGL